MTPWRRRAPAGVTGTEEGGGQERGCGKGEEKGKRKAGEEAGIRKRGAPERRGNARQREETARERECRRASREGSDVKVRPAGGFLPVRIGETKRKRFAPARKGRLVEEGLPPKFFSARRDSSKASERRSGRRERRRKTTPREAPRVFPDENGRAFRRQTRR